MSAFDTLRSQYRVAGDDFRADALRRIAKYSEGDKVNWYFAANPPVAYRPPPTGHRVSCSTYVSKSGRRTHTTCY